MPKKKKVKKKKTNDKTLDKTLYRLKTWKKNCAVSQNQNVPTKGKSKILANKLKN